MYSQKIVEDDFVLILDDNEYTPPSALICNDEEDNHLKFIAATIDELSPILRPLNLSIHDNPELGYHEVHAHKVLTDFLSKQQKGWIVTPHAYNIDTAFVAVYDSGKKGPVVSFNIEYDALPNIGNACGHNLIAMASLSAALATKAVMEEKGIGGTVVCYGTPAEEGGGGKIKLLKAGAYTDHKVDINLISHPGTVPDAALMRTAAYTSFRVEYFGKEAHAAASPWEGINALDALITAYNAISVLRQQTKPGDIIQGNITHGGLKPNIIHAYAAGQFVVRSSTRARRDALLQRVRLCFEGAATATGAKMTITHTGAYDDHSPNWALAARYRRHFNTLGGSIEPPELDYIHAQTNASTDQGNVSYALPSLSPGFWIRSEDEEGRQLGGPHTPAFARAARRKEAHGLAMRVGKALAGTAVDVLVVEGLLEEVKREFEEMKKKASKDDAAGVIM